MEIVPNIKDINTRRDVELLVDTFYKKVLKDDIIGFIFNDVVRLDWNRHIPLMYNFWETTLFQKTSYKGNPIQVHIEVDKKIELTKIHFERWLFLFSNTIDELFTGNIAELAKTRAHSIATVMQIKINKAEHRK